MSTGRLFHADISTNFLLAGKAPVAGNSPFFRHPKSERQTPPRKEKRKKSQLRFLCFSSVKLHAFRLICFLEAMKATAWSFSFNFCRLFFLLCFFLQQKNPFLSSKLRNPFSIPHLRSPKLLIENRTQFSQKTKK